MAKLVYKKLQQQPPSQIPLVPQPTGAIPRHPPGGSSTQPGSAHTFAEALTSQPPPDPKMDKHVQTVNRTVLTADDTLVALFYDMVNLQKPVKSASSGMLTKD